MHGMDFTPRRMDLVPSTKKILQPNKLKYTSMTKTDIIILFKKKYHMVLEPTERI